MGGYGALKVGLTHPEQYGTIASFSGAVDLGKMFQSMGDSLDPKSLAEYQGIFGTEMQLLPEDDILHLTREYAQVCPRNSSAGSLSAAAPRTISPPCMRAMWNM